MLICRECECGNVNASNLSTLRMSSEQIRLQIPPILLVVNSCIPQMQLSNSCRCTAQQLLVRRQKLHGSQRCCNKLAELTVDDIRQIGDTGTDCHSKLVLHSLRNNQPVQIIMHRGSAETDHAYISGSCDQMCCSILNVLQLVHDLLRCRRQNRVIVLVDV